MPDTQNKLKDTDFGFDIEDPVEDPAQELSDEDFGFGAPVEEDPNLSPGGQTIADAAGDPERRLSPWEKIFGAPGEPTKEFNSAAAAGGIFSPAHPEITEAAYKELEKSYVFQAGFNNSLMGLTYDVMHGEAMYDREALEQMDPSVIEEIGAIALGFLFDAPLFIATGGIGGVAGKAVMKPLAKGIATQGSKVLRNKLMSKGVSRVWADELISKGMAKNSKLLGNIVQKAVPTGQAFGSSMGALSSYNALSEVLGQRAGTTTEDGERRSLAEVEWRDVHKEGAIGLAMGASLAALGIGGKYMETLVKTSASPIANMAKVGLVKTGEVAAEISLFAAGDAFIRGHELHGMDFIDAAKMVAGAKLSGVVQHPKKIFGVSGGYDKVERRGEYKSEYSPLELESMEKYRPEGEAGPFTDKLSREQLIEVMADPNVSWTSKSKLLYENTGHYPMEYPEVNRVETFKSKEGFGIKAFAVDADGHKLLLDHRRFADKDQATEIHKHFRDEITDVSKRREFSDLSIADREKVIAAAHDKGLDIGESLDSWNTRPEMRDAKQAKNVRKFYKIWEEAMAPPVEGEGAAKVKPGEPVKKGEVTPTPEPKKPAVEVTPKQKIKPTVTPTQPQAEAQAAKYKEAIDRLKKEDPGKFWSVDRPSDAVIDLAAKEGRLVEVEGGMAITLPDGNMIGLIKTDPMAKGVAKAAQEARIAMGADRLDTYDTTPPGSKTSLVENYKKQGLVEIARVPFDEAKAPKDMPKELRDKKPDTVVMGLDLTNKIKPEDMNKTFESYEEALKYRDRVMDKKRTGEANDQFFRDLSAGTKGFSNVKYDPTLRIDEEKHGKFVQNYNRHRGNFDAHIEKSIPGHKEIQVGTGDAVVHTIGEGKVLDIGGSENAWAKGITETSKGKIKTVTLDPNDTMEQHSKKTPVEGNEYVNAPFMEGWEGKPAWEPKKEFDTVHESMTFQFVNNERNAQLDYIKDKVLKEDGILILEEKFVPENKKDEYNPESQWAKNEAQKDEYKRKYFDKAELTKKKEEVLLGMHSDMVSAEHMETALKERFNHVYRYWDSGNFKGYLATNSLGKAITFADRMKVRGTEMGKSEFSEKKIEFIKGGPTGVESAEITIKGGVNKIPGGYEIYDDLNRGTPKDREVRSIEDADNIIENTRKEIRSVEEEIAKRDYDKLPDSKYRLFDRTFNNKDAFLEAVREATERGNVDPEILFSNDIKTGDVALPDIAKILEAGGGFSEARTALDLTSTQELHGVKRMLTQRIERAEYVKFEDLDLPEKAEQVRSKETEDLLTAAKSEFTLYEETNEQKIAKAITEGKNLEKEQVKKIRGVLEGFLDANRKTFDRLKIPVRTRTLRQINNLSSGKHGWKQAGKIIKDITKMIEDAQWREEATAREKYTTSIEKEVDPKSMTESTGKGKGKKKAKRSYFNPISGYSRIEKFETLQGIIQEGQTNPKFRDQAYAEIKKIEDRANKRVLDRERGEEMPEGTDAGGYTLEDRVVLEQLDYATIADKDSRSLKYMRDKIKDLKKTDRMASEQARADWKAEAERRVGVIKDAQPIEKEPLQVGSEKRAKKNIHKGKIIGDMSIKSLFSTLSSRRKLAPKEVTTIFDDPINREFTKGISQSEERHSRDRQQYSNTKHQIYNDVYKPTGNRFAKEHQIKNKQLDNTIQEPGVLTIELGEGKSKELPLSQNQAGHMWLVSRQEGARETLIKPKEEGGMGWTEKTFEQLDKFLKPETKELALRLRDEMDRYKIMNVDPVYRRENGVSLSSIENYWPFAREAGEFARSSTDMGDKGSFHTRVTSDHHIDRSKSTDPFVYMDMMHQYDKYMQDQMQYTNWSETVRKLDETFRNPEVRALITQYHGTKYNEAIDWYIDRFAGKTHQDTWHALDTVIRRMSKGILYLNRSVGIKQTVSSMMYMMDMDPANWSYGMTKMLFTPEGYDLKNYLKEQPFVADRGHAPLDSEQNFVRKRDSYMYTEGLMNRAGQRARVNLQRMINLIPEHSVDQILGANIKYGDRFPILNAGGSYVMDQMRKAGTSWKKVNTKAELLAKENKTDKKTELDKLMAPFVDKWTMLSEATQQSTRISNISKWRTGNSWNRAFTMFTSGAGQIHRIATQSASLSYKAAKQGNYPAAFKHAKNFMISHVLMGAAFNLVQNGLMLDPEKKAKKNELAWAMALGNVNGLAHIGRMVNMVSNMVHDKPWADKASMTPVIESFKSIVKDMIAVNTYHADGNIEKRNEALHRLSKSLLQVVGVQAKQTFDLIEDIKTVSKGQSDKPVRQGMGIYDPDYDSGVEIFDTFDPDAWEEARTEEKALELGRRQGLKGRDVKKFRKENE